MAFVALQRLRVAGPTGALITLQAGDVVPNFEKATGSVRRALLRSNYVADTNDPKLRPHVQAGRIMMAPGHEQLQAAVPVVIKRRKKKVG